jgi:4-hydroxy-4-methyl-2-oxoglutarate aldolase
MAQWKSDEELFAWIRNELSTPPISDVMEQLGFRYPMLPAHIRAFAHGCHAYGLQRRHNVVDFRCSITIDKLRIRPGDLIFGDGDGVCVIPHEAEGEILNRALAKAQLERNVRRDIESGQSVVDAFKKHGVM